MWGRWGGWLWEMERVVVGGCMWDVGRVHGGDGEGGCESVGGCMGEFEEDVCEGGEGRAVMSVDHWKCWKFGRSRGSVIIMIHF